MLVSGEIRQDLTKLLLCMGRELQIIYVTLGHFKKRTQIKLKLRAGLQSLPLPPAIALGSLEPDSEQSFQSKKWGAENLVKPRIVHPSSAARFPHSFLPLPVLQIDFPS